MLEKPNYKILYISSDSWNRHEFQRYFYYGEFNHEFKINAEEPKFSIKEAIIEIFTNDFDAIVVDDVLNASIAAVQYDGFELVEILLKIQKDFPCFILTPFNKEFEVHWRYGVNELYSFDTMDHEKIQNEEEYFINIVRNKLISRISSQKEL